MKGINLSSITLWWRDHEKRTSPSLGPADDIAEALMAGYKNKALRSSIMSPFPERLSLLLRTLLSMHTASLGWRSNDLDST